MRPAPTGTACGPFPFSGPATFVTAVNPRGQPAPPEDNARRRDELTRHLAATGLEWHPAIGGDPDGDHLEPGAVVLGLDLAAAAALGARFDQMAVYVWEPGALHLVTCTGGRHDELGYRSMPGPTPG